MVTEKTFREDLFYRINLITLRVPPLRERRDDIPLLVRHFVDEVSRRQGIDKPAIPADTLEMLARLPYPGNIRQLRNMVERAVIMSSGTLDKNLFENTTISVPAASAPISAASSLEDLEREAVAQALERAGGNLSSAARYLGITRQALYRRMDRYGFKR